MKLIKLVIMVFGITAYAGPARKSLHVDQYIYDFSVSGGTSATVIDLSAVSGYDPIPQGAIIKDVHYKVIEALTSSANVSWSAGNTTSATGFIGLQDKTSQGADEAVGNCGTSVGGLCWDNSNDNAIDFLVNSANDADFSIDFSHDVTAGKILFWIEYYMPSED